MEIRFDFVRRLQTYGGRPNADRAVRIKSIGRGAPRSRWPQPNEA